LETESMPKLTHGTIAQKLLFAIVLLLLGLSLVGAAGAFVIFQDRSERQKIADFSLYVRERTRTEEALFTGLRAQHVGATEELKTRVDALKDADVDKTFDQLYPLKADGTRRSAPELFDGRANRKDGDFVHGVGAYLAHGRDLTPDDKRLFIAVLRIVAEHGAAGHSRIDNFYFVAPNNRMVMFGPDRKDRLLYYRENAPPTLHFSDEEMSRIVQPAIDPLGLTRCTGLRKLISDPKAPLSIACMTPVYLKGRYVGAWGATMPIGAYLTDAIRGAPAGATTLIVSKSGNLIAYPGFTRPGAASAETVARYKASLHLGDLVQRMNAEGHSFGVLKANETQSLVAYGHIDGPEWWFLISTPDAEITRAAGQSAGLILLLGLLTAVAEAALLYFVVRRMLVSPLERLAGHFTGGSPEGDGEGEGEAPDVADLSSRHDEIGALTCALQSARARSRELLRSLEARVRERTAELERANEAKSMFLANMSHELRTPLNGVIALADTLVGRQQDAESREMAALIVSSGKLLEQVLTDILDMSKIEAGEMKLEAVEFDLETLVFRIAELHRAAAEDKDLAFGWRVAPEALGRYQGDPVRVTQVLSNLLSNAVKFTSQGEVRLDVEPAADGGLSFTVTDTGIGFDDQVRERLFRRFMQADASTTRKFGGSGLGLSICASLIRLMGGEITAESAPGRGARFLVHLPLERREAPVNDAVEADPREGLPLVGLKVLLAEDHPTNQRIVELVLAPTGAELAIAENGAQALEALERERFDVVLMDMQMPVMDGLQAVAELRRREAAEGRAPLPVIMLTANAMGEHVEAARRAGANRHMAKPLRPEALIRAVAECAAGFHDEPDEAASAA
jgi:signal transduction histidine kinase/ActR/RegA family two-component response regulator